MTRNLGAFYVAIFADELRAQVNKPELLSGGTTWQLQKRPVHDFLTIRMDV